MLKKIITLLVVCCLLSAQGVSSVPDARCGSSHISRAALAPESKLQQDEEAFQNAYSSRETAFSADAAISPASRFLMFRMNVARSLRNITYALLITGTVFVSACFGKIGHDEGVPVDQTGVVVVKPDVQQIELVPAEEGPVIALQSVREDNPVSVESAQATDVEMSYGEGVYALRGMWLRAGRCPHALTTGFPEGSRIS